jgi:hypothetical protein
MHPSLQAIYQYETIVAQRIGIDRAQPRSDPGLNKPGPKVRRDTEKRGKLFRRAVELTSDAVQ